MILDKITDRKKQDLVFLKEKFSIKDLEKKALETMKDNNQSFSKALNTNGLSIIAEVKKASPSKGIISQEFYPVKKAVGYEQLGASAISCLTEEHFFLGHTKYLEDIKKNVNIPVLRKDFIIDEWQIYETRIIGADAMLLIAAILDKKTLTKFFHLAKDLSIECLVEVHNEQELYKVLEAGCSIVGINNRNLNDFSVSLDVTERLIKDIPNEKTVVSESGIMKKDDFIRVRETGADAVLIGEAFMRNQNFLKEFKEL